MAASATSSSKSNVQSIGNFLVDVCVVTDTLPPAWRTKITYPAPVVSATRNRPDSGHRPSAARRPSVQFSCMLIASGIAELFHDRSHLARYHAQGQGGRLPGLSA